jgi:hypothetical protein
MEGKGRIFTSLAIIAMLIAGSFVLLMGSNEADGYIEELITPFGYRHMKPAVDGMYMVYEDYTPGGERIMLRDLQTGVENHIVNFDSWAPDISGDRIVFLSDQDGLWDVYEYRISTTNWMKITNNAVEEYTPRIDGENVVWYEEQPGNDMSIIHYSPGRGITKLSSHPGDDLYPNIHGKLVVWESDAPGYSVIRGFDLSAWREIDIHRKLSMNLHRPDVYGDRITYVSEMSGNYMVWLFNRSTMTDLYLSLPYSMPYDINWPRIDRDHVVFLAMYDGEWELTMYDILTGIESRLTIDSATETFPVVWGEHIAFMKDRGGGQVYYMLMDYDDDGIPDQKDMFPYNPTEHFDTDGDGLGDYFDRDADNDGVFDEEDAFPYDDTEWADFDGDGIGDNADPDDDNDNYEDNDDPFPYSDINPIMDWLMELMQRLYDMEQNLSGRLDELEATLTALLAENEVDIMNGILVAVADLNDTLNGLNLSGDDDGLLANITNIIATTPPWYDDPFEAAESFFDVFTNLTVELEYIIVSHLTNITHMMNESEQNMGELMAALDALNEIEGIATDLEQVGLDVRSQNEDIENSDQNLRTYFIVLIIVMAIYSLVLIFFFVRITRKDASIDGE